MSRHDLPSGGWVELRDPSGITGGERKDFVGFVEKHNGASFAEVSATGEAFMALVLTQWSFPASQPALVKENGEVSIRNAESFDSLTTQDYDAFTVLLEPFQAVMWPKRAAKEHPLDPKVEQPASEDSEAA